MLLPHRALRREAQRQPHRTAVSSGSKGLSTYGAGRLADAQRQGIKAVRNLFGYVWRGWPPRQLVSGFFVSSCLLFWCTPSQAAPIPKNSRGILAE